MINLSQGTEALAKRVAAAQSLSVEDAIRQALEARALDPSRRFLRAGNALSPSVATTLQPRLPAPARAAMPS
jgi:hypothetical protein